MNTLPDNDSSSDLDNTEPICGETIEHDIDQEDYDDEGNCIYWHCRRCDAEGYEEAE